jgi:predicted dehydrogenase
MNETPKSALSSTSNTVLPATSRRDFIKTGGYFAAATALAGVTLPHVHAAENNTLSVALVGCGGRGTGAAGNALSVKNRGPITLTAMADVFDKRLKNSYKEIKDKHGDMVDVPEDKKFLGFDAYKHAMDSLKPGDVVILTTPLAFRWVHFTYAIQKGLNVFMEKPLTADGVTSRRMLKLGEEASSRNLKVGVGLMSRHNRAMQELHNRIQDGEIGDIILLRGYRMHGPVATFSSLPKPEGISELAYQIQRFHSFLWASGGCYSDFYIHHIDHLCWMKNAWPVSAQALGGRHYRKSPEGIEYVDQNFDNYSVEYTFADGTKFIMDGRCINGCESIYHSFAHGTKGSAVVSANGDCGLPSSTWKTQSTDRNPKSPNRIWTSTVKPDEHDPYLNEWNDLVDAIRKDQPYSEVKRGVEASVTTSMGRFAAHTGREITFEKFLNSTVELAPDVDKLVDLNSPAPVRADSHGKYPVPMPGLVTDREYKS